jgi:uncharacterized protein
MRGTDATTGKPLDGIAHLKQSIRDILTTPLGSRVMRRDYGSRIFDLVDAPLTPDTIADIYAATVESLTTWEPRIYPQRVQVNMASAGKIEIDLTAIYLPDGRILTIDGISFS